MQRFSPGLTAGPSLQTPGPRPLALTAGPSLQALHCRPHFFLQLPGCIPLVSLWHLAHQPPSHFLSWECCWSRVCFQLPSEIHSETRTGEQVIM